MTGTRALRFAIALAALAPATATAQTPTVDYRPQFSVERLTPPPGPGTFVQVEDGDVVPHKGYTFAVVTSLATRPLVIRHAIDGGVMSEPVSLRVGADILAAYGFRNRYQFGLAIPVVVFQDGDRLQRLDLPDENADEPLAATTLGDIRVSGKVRLVEPRHGYGLAAATDVIVTLPTGDDSQFTGEAGPVFEGRLVGSYRHRRFAAAVNAGARIRASEVQFLAPTLRLGNELAWGVAASAPVPLAPRWMALVEAAGASPLDGGPESTEARVGARYRAAPAWTVGATAGVGIADADAIGAPGFRAVLDVRFEPAPRVDSDQDGVADLLDRCPTEREDLDGHQDKDGCVDPDDDGDRIPDEKDECADQAEDWDKFHDSDGCPDPDNDEDGFLDKADKCPRDAEDEDGFADDDGCPDGDNDGDGVPDATDGCRDVAEDDDDFQDEDGCPEFDNDQDGVADLLDQCGSEVEDKDGWRDDDGCTDLDDDRDGVPDSVDQCPDQPETITGVKDTEADGCPDGTPMARPAPDGTIKLTPAAAKALTWKKGTFELSADAKVVVRAIARAAHRAGWDEARTAEGAAADALTVTVFGDAAEWNDQAVGRSEAVVTALAAEGVRARVAAAASGKGFEIRATPEALTAGPQVPVKQAPAQPAPPPAQPSPKP